MLFLALGPSHGLVELPVASLFMNSRSLLNGVLDVHSSPDWFVVSARRGRYESRPCNALMEARSREQKALKSESEALEVDQKALKSKPKALSVEKKTSFA